MTGVERKEQTMDAKLKTWERVLILRSTTAKLLRDRDEYAEELAKMSKSGQALIAAFAETNRELGRRDAAEERG